MSSAGRRLLSRPWELQYAERMTVFHGLFVQGAHSKCESLSSSCLVHWPPGLYRLASAMHTPAILCAVACYFIMCPVGLSSIRASEFGAHEMAQVSQAKEAVSHRVHANHPTPLKAN